MLEYIMKNYLQRDQT